MGTDYNNENPLKTRVLKNKVISSQAIYQSIQYGTTPDCKNVKNLFPAQK